MSSSAVSEVRGSTLLPVALQAGGLDNSSGRSSTTVLEYRLHRFCNRGYKYSVITASKIFISVSTWTVEGETRDGSSRNNDIRTRTGIRRIVFSARSSSGTFTISIIHRSVIGPNRPISLLGHSTILRLPFLCVQLKQFRYFENSLV